MPSTHAQQEDNEGILCKKRRCSLVMPAQITQELEQSPVLMHIDKLLPTLVTQVVVGTPATQIGSELAPLGGGGSTVYGSEEASTSTLEG
ncbi:hypothetical protein LTR37_001942 [Vermiconidia calcicola]|uniref:Uncharacterized protein n=1 Tax=Vermiconidia calcicola TaxID=1690605 RepID=A0ACC3NX07_9PEZI|nr:hypothetical protein LTR37_001942 [Vermiconidia calcicola]